jgi:hypothetical protein
LDPARRREDLCRAGHGHPAAQARRGPRGWARLADPEGPPSICPEASVVKTIIKLLIAAVILNAVARGAMAAWTYYQFRDKAEQLVIFGARSTPEQLHDQIVETAAELNVPVAPENITVEREGARTRAEAAYVQPVEFFPSYTYPVNFSFRVEGFSIQ